MVVEIDEQNLERIRKIFDNKQEHRLKAKKDFTSGEANAILSMLLTTYENINSDPKVKKAADAAYFMASFFTHERI